MKDRWINAGFEEDELKPYIEPELDITDQKRIGKKLHHGTVNAPPHKAALLLPEKMKRDDE